MIHQYKNNGYNIVLDVNSGSVHVVDDIVYDIIALYENSSVDEIADKLKDKYKEEDIREACQEIEELKEELLQYIYYYNHERAHQGIDGKRPIEMINPLPN